MSEKTEKYYCPASAYIAKGVAKAFVVEIRPDIHMHVERVLTSGGMASKDALRFKEAWIVGENGRETVRFRESETTLLPTHDYVTISANRPLYLLFEFDGRLLPSTSTPTNVFTFSVAARGSLVEERFAVSEPKEIYTLALTQSLVYGRVETFTTQSQPLVWFKANDIRFDGAESGMVTISDFLFANVSIVHGERDATASLVEGEWYFKDLAECVDGGNLKTFWPVIGPANRMRIQGSYNGKVPAGKEAGDAFTVVWLVSGEVCVRR